MKRWAMSGSAVVIAYACVMNLGAQTGDQATGIATSTGTTTTGAMQAGSDDKANRQTVTVIGCVERAKDDADDFLLRDAKVTTRADGSSAPSGSTTGPGSTATGTTGTSSSTASGSTTGSMNPGSMTGSPTATSLNTYRLSGEDETLESHVGHRVEINGTLENGSLSPAGPSTYGTGSATGTAGATTGTVSGIATTGTGTGATETAAGTGTTGTGIGTPSSTSRMDSGNDKDLPKLKVQSIRQLPGSCSGQ